MTIEQLFTFDGDAAREFTKAEYDQHAADTLATQTAAAVELAAGQAIIAAKASRDAKLAKMGFTAAEIENW